MNVPESQARVDAMNEQIRKEKVMRGASTGLKYLEDERVVGPMYYLDGLADLKWFLKMVISGNVILDFGTPEKALRTAAAAMPGGSAGRIASMSIDDDPPTGEGSSGNGRGGHVG